MKISKSELSLFSAIWCLCLKDKTKRAQGWFNPSELSSCAFISYVRTVLELNILLHKLELIDHFKLSPYMLIMRQKRRYLDLHDEYEVTKKYLSFIIQIDQTFVAHLESLILY